jgi:hypothetical protein
VIDKLHASAQMCWCVSYEERKKEKKKERNKKREIFLEFREKN